MKTSASFSVLPALFLVLASANSDELGKVNLVILTEEEVFKHSGPFTLTDYFCLDSTLPRNHTSCNILVLSLVNSTFANSRIREASLDFKHPSRPNTVCHVRWPSHEDVRTWCETSASDAGEVPEYWTEVATQGEIEIHDLIRSEINCKHQVRTIVYYRDGLSGYPDQRPTVVFRTENAGCMAIIVGGRRVNNFRTTEPPCRYFRRRRCRPLRKDQYDTLVRDVERSEIYADFRTTSEKPHLQSSGNWYTDKDVVL